MFPIACIPKAVALAGVPPGPDPGAPASYWALGEASGNAREDTAGALDLSESGATASAAGKIGDAVVFDGTTHLLNATLAPAGNFSFAGWFNTDAIGANQTVLSRWNETGGNRSFWLLLNDAGGLYFFVSSDGSATEVVFNANGLTANAWHFFAVTYDGAALKMYVDADPVEQTAYAGGTYAAAGNFLVGNGDNPSAPFTGLVDELAYFTAALTAANVAFLYNSGAGRTWNGSAWS